MGMGRTHAHFAAILESRKVGSPKYHHEIHSEMSYVSPKDNSYCKMSHLSACASNTRWPYCTYNTIYILQRFGLLMYIKKLMLFVLSFDSSGLAYAWA